MIKPVASTSVVISGADNTEDLFNANVAKVFAKARREMLSFAFLCECLRVLCVKNDLSNLQP